MSLHYERKLVYIPNVNFNQPLFEFWEMELKSGIQIKN